MSVAPLRTGTRRRDKRRLLLLGALVAHTIAVVTFGSRTAHAETTFALEWRSEKAPCVRGEAVREAVESALGRSLFVDREHADIVIDGEERRADERFRARVTQRDRTGANLGTRELEAETCAGLERMTIVVVTLFIEPSLGREEPPPPSPPPPSPPSPRSDGDDLAPPPPPRPRAPRSTRSTKSAPGRPPSRDTQAPEHARSAALHLGVGAGAALGLLPGPSMSLRGVMRLAIPRSRFTFDWSIGYSLPQSVVVDRWVRATFFAVDQQLRGCFTAARVATLELDACAGGSFSAIVPSTRGITGGDESARTLLGPTAALAARVQGAPGAMHIELGLAVPWRRRFQSYVTQSGEIRTLYASSPVIGLAGVAGTFAWF